MIGPGKSVRHRPLLRRLLERDRRLPRLDRARPRSTRAPAGRTARDFPVVTVGDMVRAQRALLDRLGIERLLGVAGGSLGGMQALSGRSPTRDDVAACVAIATTARLDTQGVA